MKSFNNKVAIVAGEATENGRNFIMSCLKRAVVTLCFIDVNKAEEL